MEPKTLEKKRLVECFSGQQKTPTSRSQWGFTETKPNQADLEKFTVWVMGSTRIKENFLGLTRCTCGTEVTSSNLCIK